MASDTRTTDESANSRIRVNLRVVAVRFAMDFVLVTVVLAFMPGIRSDLEASLVNLALLALIYGLLNAFLRPVLDLLLMPFVVQTYGLVILIVDIVIFGLLVWWSGSLEASSLWQVVVGGIALGVLRLLGLGFLGLTPPVVEDQSLTRRRSTAAGVLRFSRMAEERVRLLRVRQMMQIHGIDALFDGDGAIARFRRRMQMWLWRPDRQLQPRTCPASGDAAARNRPAPAWPSRTADPRDPPSRRRNT